MQLTYYISTLMLACSAMSMSIPEVKPESLVSDIVQLTLTIMELD